MMRTIKTTLASLLMLVIGLQMSVAQGPFSIDKNQFWSMHSALTLPLNTSANALSVGFPRSSC
ncbi:hypothetical protein PARU111607_11670 [Palleronia rufa]